MSSKSSRREFLRSSATVVGVAVALGCASSTGTVSTSAAPTAKLTKGIVWGMLPERLSYEDRFKLAADAGFEVVEGYTNEDQADAERLKAAADKAGIRITSVMNQAHWPYPLSSDDPAVVEKSMEGMRTSLRNAKLWGADAVLLVPAVIDEKTPYGAAYERSQKQIRELIPLAEELGVVITVEEVWNKFLLSPLEFARYVDDFNSPWVQAYFDVGNVVIFGYPQDWIRTLGKRIKKVHLKDFKVTSEGFSPFNAEFVNLGDGDINWPEVKKALDEIGYEGTVIAELDEGGLDYLTDVSKRIDRLLF
ncbi:MAG: sugar phosphate isomerase/epimerase [Acidobacteriota bacterium]|nr:MAG: sugar phosphate isomerase/epimerase [Acidobacteriota bacterium]